MYCGASRVWLAVLQHQQHRLQLNKDPQQPPFGAVFAFARMEYGPFWRMTCGNYKRNNTPETV